MGGWQSRDEPASIAGDGDYAIEVVSGPHHQEGIEWLAGGRGEEPTDYGCTALLELANPHDPQAVSVSIRGVRVGYLQPEVAARLIAAMRLWQFNRATCRAMIEGGWYRNAADKGDFSVWLDAAPDFTPTPPAAGDALPLPSGIVTIDAAAKPSKTGRDLVLGGAATFTLLAVIGVTWLLQPGETPGDRDRLAIASPVSRPEPAQRGTALALQRDAGEIKTASPPAGRDERPLAPATDRPSVARIVAAGQGLTHLNPMLAALAAVAEARAMPFPSSVHATLPAGRASPGDRPPEAPAARTGWVLPDRTLHHVSEDRRPAAAPLAAAQQAQPVAAARPVQPLAAVQQVLPVADRAPAFIAAAAPATQPDEPPAAVILSSIEMPLPAVQPPPAESRVAPPPPEPEAVARAPATNDADGRSAARSRADARAARSLAKYRSAARYNKRTRRTAQAPQPREPAPSSVQVQPRPAPPMPFYQPTPAARMFQAWADEWANVARGGRPPPP